MNNISHIHDKMFKETFGDTAIATDFLKAYLPKALKDFVDLDTLETMKGSFVTQESREVFADLLVKARIKGEEGYFSFLFEHKSYPDENVIHQIHKYIIAVWESVGKNKGSLPIVIPILIYNGRFRWNPDTSIKQMISNFDELTTVVTNFIPAYEYLFYDLSTMDPDDSMVSAMHMILKVMRGIMHADKSGMMALVRDLMIAYAEKRHNDQFVYYVKVCFRYVVGANSDMTKEDLLSITNQIPKEGSEFIMTLAEQFRQEGKLAGFTEGKQVGLQEGLQKATITIACNALSMGMQKEDIMKLTGLTMAELDRVIQKV